MTGSTNRTTLRADLLAAKIFIGLSVHQFIDVYGQTVLTDFRPVAVAAFDAARDFLAEASRRDALTGALAVDTTNLPADADADQP